HRRLRRARRRSPWARPATSPVKTSARAPEVDRAGGPPGIVPGCPRSLGGAELISHPPMSDPGPTVFKDRYELHRKLARGGMSDVYLARDRVLDRPVAVKVLFPEYAKDATFVERFRREAQAAARLNHPNIVAVYDWGEELGTYF